MFPATAGALRRTAEGAYDAYNKGQYARAIGNEVAGLATVPAGLAYDTVGAPAARVISGVPDFLGGLFGSKGSTAVTKVAAPKAAAPKVAAAAKAPTYPDIPITPQMHAAAEINAMLSRPHTPGDAMRAMAMVPKPLAPATGINAVAEAGASVAGRMYAQRVAAANALTDADAKAKELKAANDEYVSRLISFRGTNPADLAQAGLLAQVPD